MIKIINNKMYENMIGKINQLQDDVEWSNNYINNLESDNELKNNKIDLLAKEIAQLKNKNKQLKANIAQLKIELEDTKGFLEQEKACSNALRKERDKLKNEIDIQNNQICSLYNMFPETKKFIDDIQLLAEKYDVPEKEAKDKLIKEMKMEIKQPKKRGRKPKKVVENGK